MHGREKQQLAATQGVWGEEEEGIRHKIFLTLPLENTRGKVLSNKKAHFVKKKIYVKFLHKCNILNVYYAIPTKRGVFKIVVFVKIQREQKSEKSYFPPSFKK